MEGVQGGLEVRAGEATRKSPDRAAAGALGVGCPVGFTQQREAAGRLRQPVVTWRQVRSQAPSPLWLQGSPEFTSLRGELPLPQLLYLSVRPSPLPALAEQPPHPSGFCRGHGEGQLSEPPSSLHVGRWWQ